MVVQSLRVAVRRHYGVVWCVKPLTTFSVSRLHMERSPWAPSWLHTAPQVWTVPTYCVKWFSLRWLDNLAFYDSTGRAHYSIKLFSLPWPPGNTARLAGGNRAHYRFMQMLCISTRMSKSLSLICRRVGQKFRLTCGGSNQAVEHEGIQYNGVRSCKRFLYFLSQKCRNVDLRYFSGNTD